MSVHRLGYEEEDDLDLSAQVQGTMAHEAAVGVTAVPEAGPRSRQEVVFLVAFLSLVAVFIGFI